MGQSEKLTSDDIRILVEAFNAATPLPPTFWEYSQNILRKRLPGCKVGHHILLGDRQTIMVMSDRVCVTASYTQEMVDELNLDGPMTDYLKLLATVRADAMIKQLVKTHNGPEL